MGKGLEFPSFETIAAKWQRPSMSASSLTSAMLRASSLDRVDTRCLTCLVKVTVAYSTNVSSLPPVSRTRSAVWVPVGMYVLLQRLPPKVKYFLPLPRGDHIRVFLYPGLFVHTVDEFHDATQILRRQARRDPPGLTAIRTERSKFCQMHTLMLRCGPGAHNRLHHGCIVVLIGDVVVEVAAFAHDGL